MDPFDNISKNIQELHWRYFRAFSAFNIFDSLQKSKSLKHAGKNKANKNIQTWNDFSYFFQTVEHATRYYFFIELAKFFDPDPKKRTVTLRIVIDDISKNLSKMTHKNFLDYRARKGQPVLKDMEDDYKPISKKVLAGWERTMKSLRPTAKNIVDYRSQALAHDDTNKTFLPISREELVGLFKTLEKLLNKLSSKVDWSVTSYMNAKEASRHTKLVIDYLTDYKKVRLARLEKKWKVKLNK